MKASLAAKLHFVKEPRMCVSMGLVCHQLHRLRTGNSIFHLMRAPTNIVVRQKISRRYKQFHEESVR